jgi:hypothetical protein
MEILKKIQLLADIALHARRLAARDVSILTLTLILIEVTKMAQHRTKTLHREQTALLRDISAALRTRRSALLALDYHLRTKFNLPSIEPDKF